MTGCKRATEVSCFGPGAAKVSSQIRPLAWGRDSRRAKKRLQARSSKPLDHSYNRLTTNNMLYNYKIERRWCAWVTAVYLGHLSPLCHGRETRLAALGPSGPIELSGRASKASR